MMKKILPCLLAGCWLFMGLGAHAFADDAALLEVHQMLNGGLNKRTLPAIKEKAGGLTAAEKTVLVDGHKKGAVIPALLNGTIGFGIGSFYQGNILAGSIQAGTQAVAALTVLGAIISTGAVMDDAGSRYYPVYQGLMIGSVALYYASQLYGLVAPFIFSESYNSALKNALGYYNLSYSVDPALDLQESPGGGAALTPGVTLAVSYKF